MNNNIINQNGVGQVPPTIIKEQSINREINQNINTQPNIPNTPKKSNNILLIIIPFIILFIVGISFISYQLISRMNPISVYRNIVKTGVEDLWDIVFIDENKLSTSIKLDLDLSLEDELISKDILDLINKTKIQLDYQYDKEQELMALKLDSDYDKESLIDLELYLDNNKDKLYLYAKDYYDKYLAIDMDEYDFDSFFKANVSNNKNIKKAKKIFADEFSKIITKDNCYKENGTYVLRMSEKELLAGIKQALTNLSNNEKYLSTHKDKNVAKSNLNTIIDYIDTLDGDYKQMKITLTPDKLLRIEKVSIALVDEEIIFEKDSDKITFKELRDNETILTGYYKQDNTKYETYIDIEDLGNIKINLDIEIDNNKKMDKVNLSKVQDLEDLTDDDTSKILEKIEDSKLVSLVTSLLGDDDFDYDDYDDYFDYDDDYEFTNNSDTIIDIEDWEIVLNIPTNFTLTTDSDSYKTLEKGNSKVNISVERYDSVDKILNKLDYSYQSSLKDEYTTNVIFTGKQYKKVNYLDYYYVNLSQDYSVVTNVMKQSYSYYCTYLGDNYYLIYYIYSSDNEITDKEIEELLTASIWEVTR